MHRDDVLGLEGRAEVDEHLAEGVDLLWEGVVTVQDAHIAVDDLRGAANSVRGARRADAACAGVGERLHVERGEELAAELRDVLHGLRGGGLVERNPDVQATLGPGTGDEVVDVQVDKPVAQAVSVAADVAVLHVEVEHEVPEEVVAAGEVHRPRGIGGGSGGFDFDGVPVLDHTGRVNRCDSHCGARRDRACQLPRVLA